MKLYFLPLLLMTSVSVQCEPLQESAHHSASLPGMSFDFSYTKPSRSKNNVYQSEEIPILSSFKDWIPTPWIRIIKEAGFRRQPAPSFLTSSYGKLRLTPAKSSQPAKPRYTTKRPIVMLPRTLPAAAKKAQPSQCTCDPKTRYSSRSVTKAVTSPKLLFPQVRWPAANIEAVTKEPSYEYDTEYDRDEEDEDDKNEEFDWTDTELEYMCRRLSQSKKKRGDRGDQWSTRLDKKAAGKVISDGKYGKRSLRVSADSEVTVAEQKGKRHTL